jgi:hypothetical protein
MFHAIWKKLLLYIYVELEGLTVVVMKSSIFWDITQSSPLKFHICLRAEYRLWLHGLAVFQARNQHEVGSKLSIISQKTELFRIHLICRARLL